jgi:hypothetical protein
MSKVACFVLFFLVANPMTYDLTSKLPLVGDYIVDSQGRPTQIGVLIHALVFCLLMTLVYKMMKA